jgi:predicted Zn finger-like uncharacterized protein
MILTCPSCGTQYVVKDGAIPPEGRQVRCASCKHSWHQDPEDGGNASPEAAPAEVESPMAAAPESAPKAEHDDADESIAEATLIEPRSGPEAEERAFEEAVVASDSQTEPADEYRETAAAEPEPAPVPARDTTQDAQPVAADWREPPYDEDSGDAFSPFAAGDEEAPRRRSPLGPLLIAALVIIAVAAAFWFLAPDDLKARLGLAGAGASSLALVTTHMDRQRLESGNELLTVTGRIINPTTSEQAVPPLQAQLKSSGGKVVYSWTIAPPARSLPPGASASFNSAEVNVPPGGEELTITLGAPSA